MQEITKALIKFQGLVKNPQKNSKNPHFRSSYVNLDGLLEAVKEPLTKCDLFLTQNFIFMNDSTFLETTLMHSSGQNIKSVLPVSPDKANIQGFGSAVTYLRRYSLESICGITGSDDDDGNAAVVSNVQVNQVERSQGQRKTIQPSDKQKKFYFELLTEFYGSKENIPSEDLEDAKKMDIAAMSKAINELKIELGK